MSNFINDTHHFKPNGWFICKLNNGNQEFHHINSNEIDNIRNIINDESIKESDEKDFFWLKPPIDKSKTQESTTIIRNDGNEIQSCEDLDDSLFELNNEDFIKYNIINKENK